MKQLKHSSIGASSMHRWAACPGSVKLSEGIEKTSSVYAEEGTRAHNIAAYYLENLGWPVDADDETIEAVRVYGDTVINDRNEDGGGSNVKLFIEKRLDLSHIFPGLFGTADCILYFPNKKLLRVYDYKHGMGIGVEVFQNQQCMYYGLGALLEINEPVEEVELVIVQPRCPHPDGPVRRWRFNSIELMDFAADLYDAALATTKDPAPLKSGDHCRFCPAAGICPELHTNALAVSQTEFAPNLSYSPEKLSAALEWLPVLEGWIKSVRDFAYGEAQHGRCPPGWKLVQKRATRKWRNEDEAAHQLETILPDEKYALCFSTPELRSPAQVEKIVDKEDKKFMEALTIKESSGLVLAPERDKREAALTAQDEFTPIGEAQ